MYHAKVSFKRLIGVGARIGLGKGKANRAWLWCFWEYFIDISQVIEVKGRALEFYIFAFALC